MTFLVFGLRTYTADFLLSPGVLKGLFNFTFLPLYVAIMILLYEHLKMAARVTYPFLPLRIGFLPALRLLLA